MPHLLLNLRDVPDDEAAEVRDLLHEHAIDFYETPPNHWGISAGGIWVRDTDDPERAKALLKSYQKQRSETARAEHARKMRAGQAETFITQLKRRPLAVLLSIGIALGLLTLLVILPVLQFHR